MGRVSVRSGFFCPSINLEKNMVTLGLWVQLEAKPGKEEEVEKFLLTGRDLVEEELGTVAWFALRLGPSTFGIFDAFASEEGRQAHLNGKVAAALMAKAPDLFAAPLRIDKNAVISAKLP